MSVVWACVDDALPPEHLPVLCYCQPRTARGTWKLAVASCWTYEGRRIWTPAPTEWRTVRYWTELPPPPADPKRGPNREPESVELAIAARQKQRELK